jgi:hypothetical protein
LIASTGDLPESAAQAENIRSISCTLTVASVLADYGYGMSGGAVHGLRYVPAQITCSWFVPTAAQATEGLSRRHAAIICCSRAPMLMKTKKPLFHPAVAA